MWTQTVALAFTVGVSCVYRLCYLCFTPLPALSVMKVCVGSKTMITDSFCFKKLLASCVIWTRNDMSLFSQPQWLNSSSFPEFHHFSVLVVLIMMTGDFKHCVHHTDKTHTSLPAEPQTKVQKPPAMETCVCKSTWRTLELQMENVLYKWGWCRAGLCQGSSTYSDCDLKGFCSKWHRRHLHAKPFFFLLTATMTQSRRTSINSVVIFVCCCQCSLTENRNVNTRTAYMGTADTHWTSEDAKILPPVFGVNMHVHITRSDPFIYCFPVNLK